MSGLGPTWLVDALAAVMLTTAGYSVARLLAAWRWRRPVHYDINVAHTVMGVAMAGMLVAALHTLPTGAWEGVFGVVGVWFLGRVVLLVARRPAWSTDLDALHRLGHFLAHGAMSAAMLYMFLAITPATAGATTVMGGMAAPHGAAALGLPLVFAAVLIVSAVWHTDSLGRYSLAVTAGSGGPGAAVALPVAQRRWIAPRLEIGSHVAMCFTMGYMLILMH